MFDCRQIVLQASDLNRTRAFYIDRLGFALLGDNPGHFAFRAGGVRVSVFPGGQPVADAETGRNVQLIFRVDDLESAVAELKRRGVAFDGGIQEAPGFMKFITLLDPDRNVLHLASYHRDPLLPA